MKTRLLAASMLVAIAQNAAAEDLIRYQLRDSDSPIAKAVEVPGGFHLVFLSGFGADLVDPSAPKDNPSAYGDTKTQTLNVLEKIEAALKTMGLGMTDVVKAQVFLAGDPASGGKIDFAGMNESYRRFFGTAAQPNLPARSTIKVAGLANPGWLVEIEVTAARRKESRR